MNLGDLEDKTEKYLPELSNNRLETISQYKRRERSIQDRPK